MLLGSPPDMVRSAPSHRTHTPHDPNKASFGFRNYISFKTLDNIFYRNASVFSDIKEESGVTGLSGKGNGYFMPFSYASIIFLTI